MTSATEEIIERGLRAWITGDLDALEAVLDPAVTLSRASGTASGATR